MHSILKQTLFLSTAAVLPLVTFAGPSDADAFSPVDLLDEGRLLFETRLRYEYANQDDLSQANALTLRTRLGYESARWNGFSGLLEFAHLEALGNRDNYNAAGTNPGGAGRTNIADVPGTEVNRATLAFDQGPFTATAGRQRLVLDNARFIGNVGWRQREQTFDAVTVRVADHEDLSLFYGYIDQVNRIFGPDHPMGRLDSESHLINVSHAGSPLGTLTAYGYFLRFPENPALSSDTAGLAWNGSLETDGAWHLSAHLEYAYQTDNSSSPAGTAFSAQYFRARAEASGHGFTLGAGGELLGSDGGDYGFATPLATLHAFNGWADAFLTTPDAGLRDLHIFARTTLPGGLDTRLAVHDFRPDDGGGRYGNEVNALLTKRWSEHWSTLAKFAHFEGRSGNADITKAWLQTEYRY